MGSLWDEGVRREIKGQNKVRDSEMYILCDVRAHFVKVPVKLSMLISWPPVTLHLHLLPSV